MNPWASVTLGDICSFITDGKHGDCANDDESGFYFISAKDVRDGRISYESARQITEADFAETHRRTNLKPGDILVTNSGTIGRLAIATDDEVTTRTTFQKSVAILKVKHDRVSLRFLYYTLAANHSALNNEARGAAQKNLLLGDLRRLTLRIPQLATQAAIADILSAYDDLIENNRRRMALLEEAARQLYREWFVRLRFPGHEHTGITNGAPEGGSAFQLRWRLRSTRPRGSLTNRSTGRWRWLTCLAVAWSFSRPQDAKVDPGASSAMATRSLRGSRRALKTVRRRSSTSWTMVKLAVAQLSSLCFARSE